MTIIYIDKKKYFFSCKQKNVLEVCLSIKKNIPYFCWHPELGSIGSCRQCAIKLYKDKEDKIGSIVMACMIPAINNMRISILDQEVSNFRKSISEFMMINHPHDCPVCSEGGSCHLQDMIVLNQNNSRRYNFKKRTFKNQFLGPFINHHMNRCITCYRCVRYYNDYAGGEDLGVYGVSDKIYFGRLNDGVLESEYSGNLIDVCPTGVFTDKIGKKTYSRKWDIQYSPSICHYCSVGCNISNGERYGLLCKVDNRYNLDINGHFLCDLGRFGYNHVNSSNRPKRPLKKIINGEFFLDFCQSINLISSILKKDISRTIGIGSPRASLESNFSLYDLVGKKNFSSGMCKKLNKCVDLVSKIIKFNSINIPSLKEIESFDLVFIIGEDITQTASRAALAVRQAIFNVKNNSKFDSKNIPEWLSEPIKTIKQNIKNPLYIFNTMKTKLDKISKISFILSVEKQIEYMNFIFNRINGKNISDISLYIDENILKNLLDICNALIKSKKPLIISGTSNLSEILIKSVYNVAYSLKKLGSSVGLALFPPSVNSLGVSFLNGITLEDVYERIEKNEIDNIIIIENNLYRNNPPSYLNDVLKKIKHLIVLDHLNNEMFKKSNIFLSCSTPSESSGTVVNYESRAQIFFKTHLPGFYNNKYCILESWRWLSAIKNKITDINEILLYKIEKITERLILKFPNLKILKDSFSKNFLKIKYKKVPRSSHRFSGRTAMLSNIDVHEKTQPIDYDSYFSFSMEGNQQSEQGFPQVPFFWSPGWNSIQSSYKGLSDNILKEILKYNKIFLYRNTKFKNYDFFKIKNYSLQNFDKNNNLIIIPYYKLLGSEEMSQNDGWIKSEFLNMPAFLNIYDAKKFKISNNDNISFSILSKQFTLKVCILNDLSIGFIGLPLGTPIFPINFVYKIVSNLKRAKDE